MFNLSLKHFKYLSLYALSFSQANHLKLSRAFARNFPLAHRKRSNYNFYWVSGQKFASFINFGALIISPFRYLFPPSFAIKIRFLALLPPLPSLSSLCTWQGSQLHFGLFFSLFFIVALPRHVSLSHLCHHDVNVVPALRAERRRGRGSVQKFLSLTVLHSYFHFSLLLGVKRILALIAIVTCVLVQSRPGSVARP